MENEEEVKKEEQIEQQTEAQEPVETEATNVIDEDAQDKLQNAKNLDELNELEKNEEKDEEQIIQHEEKQQEEAEAPVITTKENLTPIPRQIREKLNIPEKFKYLEDMKKWGEEAERAYQKAASEKDRIATERNRIAAESEIHKKELEKLKKDLSEQVKNKEITQEEKEEAIENFKIEFELNPAKTLAKVVDDVIEAKAKQYMESDNNHTSVPEYNSQSTQDEFIHRQATVFADLVAGKPPEEVDEIVKDFMEIAKENPSVNNIITLNNKRLEKKAMAERRLERERYEKNRLKSRGTFNSSSVKTAPVPVNVYDKLENVKSLEELNELENQVFGYNLH